MKLADRIPVEGTEPLVHIGHRVGKNPKTGTEVVYKPWYAQYNVAGKTKFRALRTTRKDEAIKRAHQIEPYADPARPTAPASLEELAREYMEMQEGRGRAPKTIVKYRHSLDRLVKWGRDNRVLDAAELSEPRFWKFYGHLRDVDKLSPKTLYFEAVLTKQLLKWGVKVGRLASSPLANTSVREPEPTQQPCFTPQQAVALLAQAAEPFRSLLAFFIYTGCRFGEARDLLWTDIDTDSGEQGVIVIRRGGSAGTTKSGRSRSIPIHPELRPLLQAIPRRGDRVFLSPPCSKRPVWHPISQRHTLATLKALCERCGFPQAATFKTHSLRHCFASLLARSGVGTAHALDLMGHRSSDILGHYTSIFSEDLAGAVRSIRLPSPVAQSPSSPKSQTAA